MTYHFVLPFSVWWWGYEVTMQVLGHRMMHGKDIWTHSCKGQRADAHWVMAQGHKTQFFMKNGDQQKCLDKALENPRGYSLHLSDIWPT